MSVVYKYGMVAELQQLIKNEKYTSACLTVKQKKIKLVEQVLYFARGSVILEGGVLLEANWFREEIRRVLRNLFKKDVECGGLHPFYTL